MRTARKIHPTPLLVAVVPVVGPAAPLVAKVHKIVDRTGTGDRIKDKDALDVGRLLQAIDTARLAAGLVQLVEHELGAAAGRRVGDKSRFLGSTTHPSPVLPAPTGRGLGKHRKTWGNSPPVRILSERTVKTETQ